jgi:hypothetical protein
MAAKKNQQTHAKRARELAVKEKRERKRAKKAERAAGIEFPADNEDGGPSADEVEGLTDAADTADTAGLV